MSKKRLAIIGWANSIHLERWVNFYASTGNWEVLLITNTEFIRERYDSRVNFYVLKTPSELKWLKTMYNCLRHLLLQINPRNKNINISSGESREQSLKCVVRVLRLAMGVLHGWQIYRIVHNEKVDIVNIQSLSGFSIPVFFAIIFMKFTNFRKEHSIVCNAWGYRERMWWEKLMERYVVKKARCIQTSSHKTAVIYLSDYDVSPSKIEVFSWGIDLNIFKIGYTEEVQKLHRELGLNQQDKIVFHNRHLHPMYKVEKIIEIIPKVITTNPNIKFLFIRGNMYDPKYEKQLHDLAESLGIESYVTVIHRYVSPKEMAVLLNASLATISKSTPYDQLAASILESMACGAIPIISDYEGYKPWLQEGKNVFFVADGTEAKYAESILMLANNEKIYNRMRENNVRLVKQIADSDKCLRRMEDILKKALR